MITLLSNNPGLRKAVGEVLSPRAVEAQRVSTTQAGNVTADAVVTTSDISSSVARLAMRVGAALIFVLPEAAEALTRFVDERADTVLVGHDLGRIDSLVRAEMRPGEQTVIL